MTAAHSHARQASRHVWLAEGHLQHGRIVQGIEELDKAAAELAAARDDRAYVDVAKRILVLAPNRVDMWRGLASAQLRWGDVEGAGQAVVRWLQLRPGATEAIEAMAEVFGRRGRRELAAQTLARLAWRENNEGHERSAVRLIERAKSWDDRHPEVVGVAERLHDTMLRAAEDCDLGLQPAAETGRSRTIVAANVQRRPETAAYLAAGGTDPEFALAAVGL